jgi:hypothetical protein
MKAVLGFLVFFAIVLALASCQLPAKSQLDGMCIHAAVMGGMPFTIPEGAYFTANGHLVIPSAEGTTSLTGATCYVRTVR